MYETTEPVLTVDLLRGLFRNLQAFEALHESDGLSQITAPDGVVWSVHDIRYLYDESQKRLSPRQRQAIALGLYHGMKEKDAAVMMGVSPTNPVLMYGSLGLSKLIALIAQGQLPRFKWAGDFQE